MTKQRENFDQNIRRVEALCKIYTLLQNDHKSQSEYKNTDVLRSAVVLLHASFEDYFRTILIQWLPLKAQTATLKEISLPTRSGKRAEKFSFVDLIEYKEKNIEELLKDAVNKKFHATSFNNYKDIISWMKKIGLNDKGFSRQDEIEKAIKRRHTIVHETDRKDDGNLNKLETKNIQKWMETYNDLVEIIEKQVADWED